MTHLSAQDLMCDLETDYVVVGSGAGGAAAAVVLARAGAEVTVVEAGPWRDPQDYPFSTTGAMRDLFDDWGATFTRGRAFWPVVQAKAVGGTTVINSAICVRTPEDIFEQWKREHGLTDPSLAEAVWRYQDRIEAELCVEPTPEATRGRSNALADIGAKAADLGGGPMRRYVKDCAGSGQCMQGCTLTRKQSTNLNYIPEVIARGGRVLSCAPVKRILFDGRRAAGVEGHFVYPDTRKKGGHFTVRANKAVIVAASATHSPALLQRSGVRNPVLGHFFRAHPGTGIFGCYDDPVDMNTGATQGWASIKYRTDPGLKLETLSIPFELVASRISGGGAELMKRLSEFRHMAMWVQACRAETTGTVKNGMLDRPVVRYTLDRRDMERFRAGMHMVAKWHFAAGAKAIIPGIHGLPFKLGPDEVDKVAEGPLDPRCYIAVMSHLFGGCVMGSDPKRSVVDPNGRVHEYDSLVVADASAIPTNLGVNPQHTIMGLASVFAERLLEAG